MPRFDQFAIERPAFDQFVGLAWSDRGRSPYGVDCYGLLRLVYAELRGIELASFAEAYVTAGDRRAIAALIEGELDPWDQVAAFDERPFDAVLIREGGFARHVGMVTRPGMMLHVERGATSVIESYRSGLFAHRIAGFFRFRE